MLTHLLRRAAQGILGLLLAAEPCQAMPGHAMGSSRAVRLDFSHCAWASDAWRGAATGL